MPADQTTPPDPLVEAIFKAVRRFHVTNMVDDDGEPFPLVDLMTGKGCTIADGEEQMGELAFTIAEAVRHVR